MAGDVGAARDFYAAYCNLPRPLVAHYVAVVEGPDGGLAAISTCCDGVDEAATMLRKALFSLTRRLPLDPATRSVIVGKDDLRALLAGTAAGDVLTRLREALGEEASHPGIAALADWGAQKLLLAQRTVPDGCELVAAADDRWRIETGKLCARRITGQGNCREPSIAEFNRGQYRSGTSTRRAGRVDAWWPYCLKHFLDYGHWIEDDKVMSWHLRDIGEGSRKP